jgi:Mor family transcriptional regulator
MDYVNGKVIIPPELLEQLQEYVQGNLVYIPKKGKKRAGWGEKNGTKTAIMGRNSKIVEAHNNGIRIPELAAMFFLSEDSIRKILRRAER